MLDPMLGPWMRGPSLPPAENARFWKRMAAVVAMNQITKLPVCPLCHRDRHQHKTGCAVGDYVLAEFFEHAHEPRRE